MPITKIDVSPNPANFSGGKATITLRIDGTASCQEINIDWGDGTAETPSPVTLPATFQHSYTTAGNKTVRVTGQKNCQGQSFSITFTVNEPGRVDPDLLQDPPWVVRASDIVQGKCTWPTINRVVPFITLPEPGGVYVLEGCGFGNKDEGSISVTLNLTDYTGARKPPIPLTVAARADNVIAAHVPYDIDGVLDQNCTIQVNIAGKLTAPFPTGFLARRVIDYMTGARLINCAYTADDNVCRVSSSQGVATFWAWHNNRFPSMLFGTGFADESGADTYELTLLNTWTFKSLDWFPFRDPGELHIDDPDPAFPYDTSFWKPTIRWWVTPNDTAGYSAYVYIEGPFGVPWR